MLPMGFDIVPEVGGGLFTGSRSSAAGLNRPRWARITGSGGENPTRYGWEEQTWQRLPPGELLGIGLAKLDGGMFGTADLNPIVVANDRVLSVDDRVLVQAQYFDPVLDWVYAVVGNGGASSGLNVVDLYYGITYEGVRVLQFDSTPNPWSELENQDYVFAWDDASKTLTVRLNGRTADDDWVYTCADGQLRKWTQVVRNGLVKTITNEGIVGA